MFSFIHTVLLLILIITANTEARNSKRKSKNNAKPREKLSTSSIQGSKNKIFPEYGINYRHIGKINQNLNRMTIVTSIKIPKVWELIKDKEVNLKCEQLFDLSFFTQHEIDTDELRVICKQIDPYTDHLRRKINDHTRELRRIFHTDIHELLPELKSETFQPKSRPKRAFGLIATAITGLITLAVESLSSFLRNRQQKQMSTAVLKMRDNHNDLNTMVADINEDFLMYGHYNTKQIANLIKTMENLNKKVSRLEGFFSANNSDNSELNLIYRSSNTNTGLFAFQLTMYFIQLKEEHDTNYQLLKQAGKELQVAISKLVQGYLPIELFPPHRLREIISEVEETMRTQYKGYTLALPSLSHMYDMKLVTFAVDQIEQSLIVSFPVFTREHTIRSLELYEIETIHVPVQDLNDSADSYTKIQVAKPYIATNKNYYISMRISELLMCKKIRYDYYCEELFMVKHKSQPSCESAIFFNQNTQQILDHCEIRFFYNTTVPPVVLDGGSQILLANIPKNGKMNCQGRLGLPEPLPAQVYTLVDRKILCNCDLEMDMTYLLRDLNSCGDNRTLIRTKFSVNLGAYFAFKTHIPDKIKGIAPNLTIRTQTFPISLQPLEDIKSNIDINEYLKQSAKLLERAEQRQNSTQEPDPEMIELIPLFYTNILSISGAVGTAIAMTILVIIIIKHCKLRQLVALTAPATVAMMPLVKASVDTMNDLPSKVVCKDITFSYVTTIATCVGLSIYFLRLIHRLDWLKGYRHENNCQLYLMIFTESRYTPIRLLKLNHHMNLYTKTGCLIPADLQLSKLTIWDTLTLNLEEFTIWRGKVAITVPCTIQIGLKNKLRIRQILKSESIQVQVMLRQGNMNWEIPTRKIYSTPPIIPQ